MHVFAMGVINNGLGRPGRGYAESRAKAFFALLAKVRVAERRFRSHVMRSGCPAFLRAALCVGGTASVWLACVGVGEPVSPEQVIRSRNMKTVTGR